MASVSYSPVAFTGTHVSDLLRSSCNGVTGIPLRTLGRARLGVTKKRDFSVSAKIRKIKKHDRPWPKDPDPNVKGGILTHLSHFKPLKEKPKPVILEFEKPLLDIEQKINDVRKMADETGMNFNDQILALENKYQKALKELYTNLTPIQRVHIARHPNRPTFLDHVFSITDKFVELHGDRAGYDDPAIVTGIGTIDGQRYMFIGHQKGRNTKESIKRNFGMPTPHGYRKALRMMYYADHHGFPIITFIDTPGAFADLRSEEIGQGEAIAQNLRSMFGLKVPIVSVVIGEGGSGGALAIGCANKLLMLENAVFYVASPEACAAILWKSAKAAPKAAKRLRITAAELCRLKVADSVIPEPLGGAHADPSWTSERIKNAITNAMEELKKMDTPELLKHRMHKFRQMGGFQEGIKLNPKKKVNMKKSEVPKKKVVSQKKVVPIDQKTQQLNLEHEVEKLKQQISNAMQSYTEPPMSRLNKLIEKLQKEVDLGFSEAANSLGFKDKFAALQEKFFKVSSGELMDPAFKDKLDKLRSEFNQSLPKAPNYERLKKKLELLKELSKAKSLAEKIQKTSLMKEEINLKLKEIKEREDIKEKFAALKAEIQNSGVSKFEDMDTTLREKVESLKNEIESEFALVLQSLGLDVEVVNSNATRLEEPAPSPEIKTKIENFNGEIEKGIEQVVNSTDLKYKIAELRRERAKAGKKPDLAARRKIEVLEDQIKQALVEALDASSLKEKHDNLKAEISEGFVPSGGPDGSLKQEDPEEVRETINVGINRSFA